MITLYRGPAVLRNNHPVTTWKAITKACPPPFNRLIWLNDGATAWIGMALLLPVGDDLKIHYTHTQNQVWLNDAGEWCCDYHIPSTEHNPIVWQDLPTPFKARYLPEISR